MSAQPKPNEPSMEEILASIRRIISDDETKPAEEGAAAAPATPPAPEPETQAEARPEEDDVLDLGAEAALVPAEPPKPAPAIDDSAGKGGEHADDLMFVDEPTPAPESAAPAPPPDPEPEPPRPAPFRPEPIDLPPLRPSGDATIDMAALLSDQASSTVASAFGQLAHTVLSNNARTLEDLVKEMLRPMLKSWLDENLPSMVERLVRAEIERVARGGRS